MMAAEPFPFATVNDLKARWPDFTAGAEAHAEVLLGDASQFMLDAYPACVNATANTRKRIVCAVVKRSMQGEAEDLGGVEQMTVGTGPFQDTIKPLNPHGDFYLTEQEQRSLGLGKGRRQQAFEIDPLAVPDAQDQ